jgi:hypothetical protein
VSSPRLGRRSAERFAELIDTDHAGHGHHRRTSRGDDMVELTRLTRDLSQLRIAPEPDAEFRSSLRSFLVATAERDGIGAATEPNARSALTGRTQIVRQVNQPGPTTGRTRLALLAGATIGAILLSGVSVASTGSLPGDALYRLKISTEQAQVAMAGSAASRGQLYLGFARSRLAEATRVDRGRLASTLDEMDQQTLLGVQLLTAVAAAGDTAALTTISDFVTAQRDALLSLSKNLPAETDATVAPSLALLDRVESRVGDLAMELARGCPQPGLDDLGVNPATC